MSELNETNIWKFLGEREGRGEGKGERRDRKEMSKRGCRSKDRRGEGGARIYA